MEQNKPNYDVAKRNRAVNMFTVRVLVAAYLIYLGVTLIINHLNGSSDMPAVLVWLAGPLFTLGAGAFIWYAWRRFRTEKKESELPDDPAEDAEN